MEKQNITVSVPKSALKPEDFGVDAQGNLTLDKTLVNKLVKENINKSVRSGDGVEVTVTVGVSF